MSHRNFEAIFALMKPEQQVALARVSERLLQDPEALDNRHSAQPVEEKEVPPHGS